MCIFTVRHFFFCMSKFLVLEESFFDISLVSQSSLEIDKNAYSLLCTVCLKAIQEYESSPENWTLVSLVNPLKGGFQRKVSPLYVAAFLPGPFYCVQTPSCSPVYTADRNFFCTKSELLSLVTEAFWWEGQDTPVVYPNSRL